MYGRRLYAAFATQRLCALEWAAHGVKVHTVVPTVVDAPLMRKVINTPEKAERDAATDHSGIAMASRLSRAYCSDDGWCYDLAAA